MKSLPTIAEVQRLLDYDPKTGVFRWRDGADNRVAGRIAGYASNFGYRQIGIDGRKFGAHRLAWLLMRGEEPTVDLDHINGNRDDNRIANLRKATRSQNIANSRLSRRNSTGFKGVTYDKRWGHWRARIIKDRAEIHLGIFSSPEAAHAAYCAAARGSFGEFARAD
jgi:hypothetical protein